MNRTRLAFCAIVLSAGAGRAVTAQLSLGDAIRQADRSAYGNRIAAGASAVQSAQALAPLKGILPSLRFEAGFVRTTDPIGVFGSTLRQRTITQADFDPQRLNYPGAVGNYQGGVVLEQPLFNPDAWIARRAAAHAVDASRALEEWTQISTRADVVRAYYGAVLASERAATLHVAARAAHAHVAQAEALVRQGLVTKSDALLASVRAGEIDAHVAEADGAVATARRQLAVLLGGDGEAHGDVILPAELPSGDRIRAVVAQDTVVAAPTPRADVRAASEGLDAARSDALRARSVYLPRVNAFGRYDWNSPDRLYAGDRNWTAGIMASWSVLAGASDVADVQMTAARAVTAQAQAGAAQANARLDAEQTRIALVVALTRLSIAERAVAQSEEAHRIVGRKYEGGLATVVELLDAQAVATQSALAHSQARWGVVAAAADRLRALGRDPASLEALDASGAVAAAPAESHDHASP